MQSLGSHEHRFTAPDMGRALRKLGEELGPDAVLLSSRKVIGGVEVIALPPGVEPSTDNFESLHSDRRQNDRRASERTSAKLAANSDAANQPVVNQTAVSSNENIKNSEVKGGINSAASRLAESIGTLQMPFSDATSFEDLRLELQQVKQMLQQKISQVNPLTDSLPKPMQYLLINRIVQMGLPMDLARVLTQGLGVANNGVDNESEAWTLCLRRLAALMPIAENDLLAGGGTVALLGPSGAGKSAAIAKLAGRWMIANANQNAANEVAIISHDSGSTAGFGRLSRFSSMTGVPIFYVDNQHSLSDRISQCAKRRLVLIDTVSLSQENPEAQFQLAQLAELKQLKSLLVLPATGEQAWLTRAIKTYRQANTVGCILSNMDQVESIGGTMAVMIKEKLAIQYLSKGGLLPKYIQLPTAVALMARLTQAADDLSADDGFKHSDGYNQSDSVGSVTSHVDGQFHTDALVPTISSYFAEKNDADALAAQLSEGLSTELSAEIDAEIPIAIDLSKSDLVKQAD